MKKYIPLIAFGTLFCIGLLVKDNLLRKLDAGIAVSESEEAIYHIIQMLLWIPIGTISGLGMLLFPMRFKDWWNSIFGANIVWHPLQLFMLRILGFGLIVFTLAGIKSYFDLYFDLFFK